MIAGLEYADDADVIGLSLLRPTSATDAYLYRPKKGESGWKLPTRPTAQLHPGRSRASNWSGAKTAAPKKAAAKKTARPAAKKSAAKKKGGAKKKTMKKGSRKAGKKR